MLVIIIYKNNTKNNLRMEKYIKINSLIYLKQNMRKDEYILIGIFLYT
jgi:hypothetical protein